MYPSDYSDVDHESLQDACGECGCGLYAEERERGLCDRCYRDVLEESRYSRDDLVDSHCLASDDFLLDRDR